MADITAVPSKMRPLIPVDCGWLFVVAGLVMIVAAVLLPPQRQLFELRRNLDVMQSQERLTMSRLRAYSEFLRALEVGDPVLTRRLASAHLNLVREGHTPLLISDSGSAPITSWIEATLAPQPVATTTYAESHLVWLVEGPLRHWILGGAVLCLFAGLLMGSGHRPRDTAQPAATPYRLDEFDNDGDGEDEVDSDLDLVQTTGSGDRG